MAARKIPHLDGKRISAGLGLALYVVKEIVRAHGGAITARFEYDQTESPLSSHQRASPVAVSNDVQVDTLRWDTEATQSSTQCR